MSEGKMGAELLRALRDRNTQQADEITAMWKCIDAADKEMPSRDDAYWKARSELQTLLKKRRKEKT